MFVQIIEGHTTDPGALKRQVDRWETELRPRAAGFLGVTSGSTADGRAITVARFDSETSAKANSDRPEQGTWWAETAKCYDGEVTFTESSDVQEFLGGGSNDAGFVQVMKTTGVDRARVQRLDEAMPQLAKLRPDLLGVFRAWTGPTSCIDVIYFRSEADARAGERNEIPAELQPVMAEFQEMTRDTEYLDLTDPVIH